MSRWCEEIHQPPRLEAVLYTVEEWTKISRNRCAGLISSYSLYRHLTECLFLGGVYLQSTLQCPWEDLLAAISGWYAYVCKIRPPWLTHKALCQVVQLYCKGKNILTPLTLPNPFHFICILTVYIVTKQLSGNPDAGFIVLMRLKLIRKPMLFLLSW